MTPARRTIGVIPAIRSPDYPASSSDAAKQPTASSACPSPPLSPSPVASNSLPLTGLPGRTPPLTCGSQQPVPAWAPRPQLSAGPFLIGPPPLPHDLGGEEHRGGLIGSVTNLFQDPGEGGEMRILSGEMGKIFPTTL